MPSPANPVTAIGSVDEIDSFVPRPRDVAHTRSMPLDYASYQVDSHQLWEAIGTHERGEALLWPETRHSRTAIAQPFQPDPDSGHEPAAVNVELEKLTESISPSLELSIDDGRADDLRVEELFGRVLLQQHRLLNVPNVLILQTRALPRSSSLVTSPSFDTLRSDASSYPVITRNHSIWRSDIPTLLHNTSLSQISAYHDFYDRTNALKDKLLDS